MSAFFLINQTFAAETATETIQPTADDTSLQSEPAEEHSVEIPQSDSESVTNEPPETTDQIASEVTEEVVESTEIPTQEVEQDSEITPEDLGATAPRILPDNPLYVFKRIGRGINLLFTRDPIKRAEKELDFANQEFIEAKKMFDEKGGKVASVVARVIDRAENRLENIANRVDDLQEKRKNNPDKVKHFLDRIADSTIKQQKLLDKIEEQVPEQTFSQIRTARERSLEHLGNVLVGAAGRQDEISEYLNRAIENQTGSDFKDFKNIEILKALEDRVPEAARYATRQASENALNRLEENLTNLPEDKRENFQNYIRHLPGDSATRLEVLDDLRARSEIGPGFIRQIDLLKTKAIERFEDQFNRLNDIDARERLFSPIREGSLEGMRIAEQIQNQLPQDMREELQAAYEDGLRRFRENFATDPNASQVVDMTERAMQHPDAIDFSVLQRIREGMTSGQQTFIDNLEQSGRERILEQMQSRGDEFFERFVDPNAPQSLEVLQGLRGTLPPEAMPGIERAIQNQRQRMEEHMNELQNPEIFERIQELLTEDQELKQSFESGDPTFFQRLESRREDLERRVQERQEQTEDQSRPLFENSDTPILEIVPENIRQRNDAQRTRIKELNQPETEIPLQNMPSFMNDQNFFEVPQRLMPPQNIRPEDMSPRPNAPIRQPANELNQNRQMEPREESGGRRREIMDQIQQVRPNQIPMPALPPPPTLP